MQWTAGENAGFTSGTPWLKLNPRYTEINAEAELATGIRCSTTTAT